ncbi:MAG: pirin [bacterium]|nr:pirin [bacterium]
MARILVQATLPHSRPHKGPNPHEFERVNGRFTLYMNAPPSIGLPYGSYPRLALAWLSTEAVRTRNREIELGPTFSSFMYKLGLTPVTGKRGTTSRLRDQLHRLFSTTIRCSYSDGAEGHAAGVGYTIAHSHQLWWSPRDPEQQPLWNSVVILSTEFYDELVAHAVPIDLRALKALKGSPLALDIYSWLTYRMSYLRKPCLIPWVALQAQFGANYARPRDFKKKFLAHLADVLRVYPAARLSEQAKGLLLKPSPTHLPRTSSGRI